jgi:hypothetical protein
MASIAQSVKGPGLHVRQPHYVPSQNRGFLLKFYSSACIAASEVSLLYYLFSGTNLIIRSSTSVGIVAPSSVTSFLFGAGSNDV